MADPRNLALALQAQHDIQAIEAGGRTPFTDAMHATLNQIAVLCAQYGLLDAAGLTQLGFNNPQASMAGPHPLDGGGGSTKHPPQG